MNAEFVSFLSNKKINLFDSQKDETFTVKGVEYKGVIYTWERENFLRCVVKTQVFICDNPSKVEWAAELGTISDSRVHKSIHDENFASYLGHYTNSPAWLEI